MAAKHLKLLKSAHKGATSLILKTIKSTPADALESDLSVLPVDLHSEELQRYEVVKLLIKQYDYIQPSMVGRNRVYKMGSPFENIRSLTKQILQFYRRPKNGNVNQLLLPKETTATFEIFHVPNLWLTLPETELQLPVPLENTNILQH